MAEQARNDRGYSLVELMSVLGVLGVILTAVFLSLQALQVSANVAQRDAWVASCTADSLAYLDKTISQATSITAGGSGGTRIQFITDQDLDGVSEQHSIEVSSGRLTDSVYRMPGGVPTVTPVVNVIIESSSGPDLPYCANDASNPLFAYLSSDGSSTVDPTQARFVRLTVLIGCMGRTFSDGTQVFLRNRQY